MKTKYIVIIMCSLIILFFIVLVLLLLLPKLNEKKIENINHLRFTYTTGYHMNASVSYEIDLVDGKYIVKVKPTDVPEEDTQEFELTKDKILEIENTLNEYHVSLWNGFHKSDKYVLDGDSFSMNITYNKENTISASGYMMWPKSYSNIRNYLDTELGRLYKTE